MTIDKPSGTREYVLPATVSAEPPAVIDCAPMRKGASSPFSSTLVLNSARICRDRTWTRNHVVELSGHVIASAAETVHTLPLFLGTHLSTS